MLILSRKKGEAILVGDDVKIVIISVGKDKVKLGIEAPKDTSVHRDEVYDIIKKSNEK